MCNMVTSILSEGVFSSNPKGFLMHGLAVYVREECLPSFSSINHLLHLDAQFSILSHLMYMKFPRSTHMLMCLSLET